jgi:hypothetical protein
MTRKNVSLILTKDLNVKKVLHQTDAEKPQWQEKTRKEICADLSTRRLE